MTTMAIPDGGQLVDPIRILKPIRDRIRQAREHRKQFEPTWQSNLAFAAGKHWLVWDRDSRQLRRIQDMDKRYRGRELYSVDLITEYRTTVLGELGSDDDRPELLLQQEGKAGEDFQAQVNRALGYAWDFECGADEALAEVDRMTVDLGTAAVRCRFDPTLGPPRQDDVPFYQGQPMLDLEQARELMSGGVRDDVSMQSINEGRITWEPLSPFNLLVPPGVTHERYFPWEAVIRPTLLADVHAEFGDSARDLREDGDIASTIGIAADSAGGGVGFAFGEARETRVRDHIWLVTYYERPTAQNPKGRTLHFGGNDLKLLRIEDRLPYQGPDGTYRAGIAYFHWWRVTGRFWSRALVENLKDGQRAASKRRTQQNEIIDRGLPYLLAAEGTEPVDREGTVLEVVRYPLTGSPPTPVPGIGPGPWMTDDMQQIQSDMERASGVRGPSLGENPQNVSTYSQLQLLKDSDVVKRQPTIVGRKAAIASLVEDTVYDMRTWWGHEKQIMLAGEEDVVQAEVFDATRIPAFFIVKVAKGAPLVRSQAAELTKVENIAQYSLNSRMPLPVRWLKESLDAGQAMELPEDPGNAQVDKAELENHLLTQGQEVPVAYYDPIHIHLPIHRTAQIEAELAGDFALWYRIEAHVQDHLAAAQAAAVAAAAAAPTGEQAAPTGAPSPDGQAAPEPPQEPPVGGA